jgi:hypothetical protein
VEAERNIDMVMVTNLFSKVWCQPSYSGLIIHYFIVPSIPVSRSRASRAGTPEGAFALDSREWEEEQMRLDRDWYTGAEEGGVAGDEEHNPLSQYEDLRALKEAEIAVKQVVSRIKTICQVD